MARYDARDDSYDLLQMYLNEAARTPPLTLEREKELGRRIQSGEDDGSAIDELVAANLLFVHRCAKEFRNPHVPLIDLISEGNLGLIRAATKYDPEKNVKFITYAVWWIRQSILQALSAQAGPFRLPPKRANLINRLEKAIRAAITSGSRIPTSDELARELGITTREVQTLLTASADHLSLSAELDDESHTELSELVEQTMMPSIEVEMEKESRHEELLAYLAELKPKERIVLMLRYGICDHVPKSLPELSKLVDLPHERVCETLASAESQLCAALQVSRPELAYLLLYTSPNSHALDQWNALVEPGHRVSAIDSTRHEAIGALQQHGDVQAAIDALPTAEKVLIRLRYGILQNEELTLREIGDFLGVSRERVRQIEATAERKTQRSARTGAHDARAPQRYTPRQ